MVDEQQLVYVLLQYARNENSAEAFIIGLVLFDPQEEQAGFCKARFLTHWKTKILQFDPDADVEVLKAIIWDIEQRLSTPNTRVDMLHQMETSFSCAIRISERKACSTRNPNEELNRLISVFE